MISAFHIPLVWPQDMGPDGLPLLSYAEAAERMIDRGFRDIHYVVDLGAKCATQNESIPCQPPRPGDKVIYAPAECGSGDGFGGTDPEKVYT